MFEITFIVNYFHRVIGISGRPKPLHKIWYLVLIALNTNTSLIIPKPYINECKYY